MIKKQDSKKPIPRGSKSVVKNPHAPDDEKQTATEAELKINELNKEINRLRKELESKDTQNNFWRQGSY